MNYLELINHFWAKDAEYHFSDKETALYFYLLNVCNSVRWRNPFGLSDKMTMAKFGWGKTSFDRARGRLKAVGLIDYRLGIGRGNIYRYIIKDINDQYRDEKDVQTATLFDQFSGKGYEKGVSTDIFSDKSSEKDHGKGDQMSTFSGQFSQKDIEKGTQINTFSEKVMKKVFKQTPFPITFMLRNPRKKRYFGSL